MTRYTDRDCIAALIRVASLEREHGRDIGVHVHLNRTWTVPMVELAERLGVPCHPPDFSGEEYYELDHAPSAYGGGVRPALLKPPGTGHYTPEWWGPSAGLGPGAVPRKYFIYITSAVAGVLRGLLAEHKQ